MDLHDHCRIVRNTVQRRARNKSLACYCAKASLILEKYLTRLGYECEFVQGLFGPAFIQEINHCWLVVKDGNRKLVVDITATQFSSRGGYYPEVYILPIKAAKEYSPVRQGHIFHDWPDDQVPQKHWVKRVMKDLLG